MHKANADATRKLEKSMPAHFKALKFSGTRPEASQVYVWCQRTFKLTNLISTDVNPYKINMNALGTSQI